MFRIIAENINVMYKKIGTAMKERNIKPEELPRDEDVKKVERRLKSEEKKLPNQSDRFDP